MKFTNTKKKNNEGLLYKTGVSRPLEDMGSGTTHSTYTESVQNRINEHNTELENIRLRNQRRQRNRQEFQMAIELAKQNTSSNSNVAAGTDRTTQLKNANAQYQAQLAEGKDYLNMNQAQLTGEGIRSLYGSFKNWAAGGEKEISEADSKAHAEETLAPLDAEERKLLQDYVESQDITTSTNLSMGNMYGAPVGIGEFSPIAQSEKRQNAKKAFMEKTGVDEATFEKYIENEAWLTHYNESEARANEIKDTSGVGKAGLTALDVAMANIPSLYAMGGAQKPNDPELGRDYHTPYAALSDVQKQTEEAVNEDIEDIENPIARKAAYFGYNGAVAAGKSAMGLLYGGEIAGALGLEGQAAKNVVNLVTLPTFGVSAYESTYQDAAERGLTTRQATTLAVTAGTAEVVTEVWSLDSLWDLAQNSGSKAAKNAVVNALVQSGIEGSEEVGSDIINDTADVLINGDKSVYYTKVQDYMASGMSEEDAKKQATKDYVDNAINDFVLGAVSGGVSAGAVEGVNAATDTYAGRTIARDNATTSALVLDSESADYISDKREDYNSDEEYNAAQETRQAILDASNQDAMGKRISGKQARAITKGVRDAYESLDAKSRAVFQERVETARKEAEDTAIKQVQEASTPSEVETIAEKYSNNENIVAAVEEKKAQMVEAGEATQEDFTNALTPVKARELAKSGEEISSEELEKLPEEVQSAYKIGYSEKAHEVTSNISNTDVTNIMYKKKGKSKVEQIKSVSANRNEIVFETESGAKVPASEVQFSENERAKYLYTGDNGILSLENPALVQLAIDVEAESSHGISIANVTTPIKTMYTQGAAGLNFDSAMKSLGLQAKSVSEDVLRKAYEEGAKNSTATERATTNVRKGRGLVIAQSEDNETEYKAQFRDSKGNYSEEVQNKFESEVSDTEKKFLELLSKKISVDIRFTSDNSGNRGEYKPNEGTIYLNLNNGINMFEVALHEGIGEFLAASNEKAYNQIVDSVLNAYAAINSNKLASDIREYQKAYAGDKYGNTPRGASRELFNDAIGEILSTESNLKKMFDWMVTNEGTAQAQKVKKTLVDYFHDLVDMIKSIKKLGGLSRLASNRMRLAEEEANKYADMIFKAMDEAIANRDAAVNAKLNAAVENNNSITPENLERSSKYVDTDKLEDIQVNTELYLSESDIDAYLAAGSQAHKQKVKNHRNGKQVILRNEKELNEFVEEAIKGNRQDTVAYGRLSDVLSQKIMDAADDRGIYISIENYFVALVGNDLYHSYRNHADPKQDGDLPLSYDELLYAIKNINTAEVDFITETKNKTQTAYLSFDMGDGVVEMLEVVSTGNGTLNFKNAWKQTYEKHKKYKSTKDVARGRTSKIARASDAFLDSSLTRTEDNSTDNLSKNDEEIVNNARHSFAGIRSQTADKVALEVAKNMYNNNEDDLSILAATGWFLGSDNAWKYEIADNDAEIFKDGNAKIIAKYNNDYRRYGELLNAKEWTEDIWKELSELEEKLPLQEINERKVIGTLEDFLQHEKLFRAYPFLKDITVYIGVLDDTAHGQYNPNDKTIAISSDFAKYASKDALKSTLLHEVQHAIQDNEFFGRGSSASEWSRIRDYTIDTDTKRLEKARENLEREKKVSESYDEPTSTKEFTEDFWKRVEDVSNPTEEDDFEEEFKEWKKGNIYHYEQQIAKLERNLENLKSYSDKQLYTYTPGEIEARDVQDRMNLSDEQRKQTVPNLEEDMVVYPAKEGLEDRRYSKKIGDIEQKAIEHFGTTDSFRVAGYMLQDGTLLDFSGAHWLEGEDPEYIKKWKSQNDIRQVDHEDIYEVMEASGDNRKQFMDRGNIRLNPEAPGFNISTKTEPTPAQYRELKEFIREIKNNPYYDASRFYVDIEDTHPNKISYANNLNEDRIINDIKRFYATGELPQESSLNDFRYSIKVDTNGKNYVDIQDNILTGITDDKQIKDYVKEYLKEYYPSLDMLGFDLPVNAKSRSEFTNSKYTKQLENRLHDFFIDKMRIAGNLEEVVSTAEGYTWEQIKHSRKDNALGFVHGKIQLRIGRNDYIADVVLEDLPKAGLIFYDIVDMQPTKIKAARKELMARKSSTTHTLTASNNRIPPSQQNATTTSSGGIAEKGRKSKAVFGDASPYSDTINQAEYVSQVLSTLNNQLKGTSVSPRYIKETVDYILDKYKSTVDANDLTMELSQFIAYMTASEQVDYNQMMNYLMNIGDEVIQASELKDPESQRVYNELKKELSSHKIRLTEVERKELTSRFGGEWKTVFGALNSIGIKLDSKNGQHMDAGIYEEIANKFREIGGVYLDESATPVDQIATIIDAMDAMQPSAYEWEGANQLDKALDVATTIIDRYYSMASYIKETNIVKGTEKGAAAVERAKQAEIKRLRAKQSEWKEKLNENFAALVEDKKKMVAEQQEFYRKQAEAERKFRGEQRKFNQKVNMSEKELAKTAKVLAKMEYQGLKDTEAKKKHKDNIVRTCTRLINWMNKPTDARHVPTFLKPALSDMIKAIDFMPASMRKGEDGTISAKKWQESMRKLQQVLTGLNAESMESMDDSDKYNLALVLNAEDIVVRMEELLNKYNGTADISKMSKEDLKTLSDIMKNISTGISKMNENFMNRRFKHVGDAAVAAMDEMDKLKPISNKSNAIKSGANEFLNLDMLDPYSFFHELGDAASSIMQEFYDGEKIGVEIIREAEDFFTELTNELGITQKDLRQWENEQKDYTFVGKTITLTPAEIMSLYCSYNREKLDQQERPFEATHHIMSGGIKVKERKIGHTPISPVVNRNTGVLHLTEAQVFELMNTLTTEQIAYADKVVDYMSTTLAAHGNETSNKISGFSKFLGKKYFPLKTDSNTIATNESNSETGLAGLMRLIHPSFTKSQLDKADNALVLMNFFDVVTEHITGMSNYCAYAMPLSDAMRWYNYAETERNATDIEDVYWRDTRTLKSSMEKVKGKGAKNYFENFLRDVNLDPVNKGGSKFVAVAARALTGLGRAKAIGLNASVWLQQPTAIVRASNVIEGKYLAQGISKMMIHPRQATKYAQDTNYLCYWKSKGFSDYRVSMGMKEIITGHNTKLQAAQEKAGAPAGIMDDVTWASMYYAAENKIKATTNLDVNSEEYRKQVDELFSEIINQTQVIDSTLRTTQTMRSKNDFEYLANAFKKEPQKSYNMLHRAAFDVYQAESVEDKRIANKAFRKALKVFLLTSVVNGMIVAAVQAWRDDDDENYLIKWLKKLTPYGSYEAIMEALDDEDFEAKDLITLIRGIWGGIGTIGDNADIFSAMPLISEVDSWLKGYEPSSINHLSILGEAHKTVTALTAANATEYKIVYSLATLSDYVTGIGISNAMRDIRGIWNQSTRITGLPRIEKSTDDAKKTEKNKQKAAFTEAYESNDLSTTKAAMQDIYNQQIEAGKDESGAWKAVRTTLKEEYLSQISQHPEDVVSINNRFKKLLENTKKADGKGGYRKPSDKEISNWIENWNKGSE